jgi:uncharacterized membrane protein YhhN
MIHYLAYLDAGSGSMIVQAIVAGAAGAAVFLKLYWRRLTGAFRKPVAAEAGTDSATAPAGTAASDQASASPVAATSSDSQ